MGCAQPTGRAPWGARTPRVAARPMRGQSTGCPQRMLCPLPTRCPKPLGPPGCPQRMGCPQPMAWPQPIPSNAAGGAPCAVQSPLVGLRHEHVIGLSSPRRPPCATRRLDLRALRGSPAATPQTAPRPPSPSVRRQDAPRSLAEGAGNSGVVKGCLWPALHNANVAF